jgi:cytochrome c
MRIRGRTPAPIICGLTGIALVLSLPAFSAVDAEALAKDSKCLKCHAVAKKKDGPAFRDIAAKFRSDPEAQGKLLHHLTSGERVKFPDGHEEEHKKVTDDSARVLINWIRPMEGGTPY